MNSSQLSLFDTNAATGSAYKTGDYVKLRRKPRVAAWVKRGEVFRIDKVHPVNGSLKFWNPHINQWDFLYPEEVKLTVEPVVGEIAPAAQSIAESVIGEVETTELTVEPVVGEIAPAAQSIAEPVVGEVAATKNYWNSDEGYSGNGWLETHYKIRRGGKQHSINCPEIGCTGPYYSYRWMEGKRQRAKYCPGSKCPAVRKALRNGEPISKILEIINQ
ncbi:hypothetical protein [Microcoleus sp. Pol12A5]|uniref:hypothetical protein n=1 Tax=Microcoleus sp. Pol12A5 TaxID=3055392 RepID=UPI002FD461B0